MVPPQHALHRFNWKPPIRTANPTAEVRRTLRPGLGLILYCAIVTTIVVLI